MLSCRKEEVYGILQVRIIILSLIKMDPAVVEELAVHNRRQKRGNQIQEDW